jgi:hypothetical protein
MAPPKDHAVGDLLSLYGSYVDFDGNLIKIIKECMY